MPVAALVMLAGCNGNKKADIDVTDQDSAMVEETIADSSYYGVLGEATTMNALQLITDVGDTMDMVLASADNDMQVVMGGMLSGDRVAVSAHKAKGELVADKVINITSLLGKWTSIDKSFEIKEGGTVVSTIKAETNPWTTWKLLNGNIILNTDTFSIEELGPDSLCLENPEGIFAYRRQPHL